MGMWIAIAVGALLLVWLVAIYNRLVRFRALVREAWSGITVQLRRRADLIPNLVSTVEGYASHERGLLEAVTEARSAAGSAKGLEATAQADAQMTGMIGRL
ncbi:MAG: LemA family protein, partial [Rhizobiaceae bacterium]